MPRRSDTTNFVWPPQGSNAFQAYPQFGAGGAATVFTPYVLPVKFQWQQAQVPKVCGVAGPKTDFNSGIVDKQYPDFQLNWANNQGNTPWYAAISVLPAHLWSATPDARTALRANWDQFLINLYRYEDAGCLAPGGAALIRMRVAEALPLTFNESLYYRYSFEPQNPTGRYIDLLPGMRLRVESSALEFDQKGSLTGFVNSSVNHWHVGRRRDSDGQFRLAFDAFLGALAAPAAIGSSVNGIGSLMDLQLAGNARRFYRLFYPAQLNISGSTGLNANPTLIGADTYDDLLTATAAYVSGKTTCAQGKAGRPIICAYFRGRVTPVPELPVCLNNEWIYVSVGTSLRNLIDRVFNWGFPAWETLSPPNAFSFTRQWTDNSSFQSCTPASTPLAFYGTGDSAVSARARASATTARRRATAAASAATATSDVYELPVVLGDSLTSNL